MSDEWINRIKQELEKNYKEVLVDSEKRIAFKVDDSWFLVIVDPNDDKYVRTVYPNFYKVNKENKDKIQRGINSVNSNVKIAKIIEIADNLWITFEAFYENTNSYIESLPRIIGITKAALKTFLDSVK